MPGKPKSKYDEGTTEGSRLSGSSLNLTNEVKPKKQKPMTKKEKDKLRKVEKEMKETLIQLRKEADAMLAEFKAMADASERKAKAELFEHTRRVELLSGTCETFKGAKARLLHENNKLRDAEIWERYTTTDRKPYPENVPDMHNHLYLWQQSKEYEYMEFALSKCDSYVDTLVKLDELIEYPLYATTATISNWKELRREWREEFLLKIDKACFNMIKNLAKNFEQKDHIFYFNDEEEHVKLAMCAYVEHETQERACPKIAFPTVGVEVDMPAVYRTSPFILRMVHLDQDFFSESSLTYYCLEADQMESDLLSEIHRCYEAKKEAKSLVADREREKVRQAKLKVVQAQEAAREAEMSFQSFQLHLDPIKKIETRISLTPETPKEVRELKRNKPKADIFGQLPSGSDITLKRPRGLLDEKDGESVVMSLLQSIGSHRTLDTISLRSGMRKKHDRTKQPICSSTTVEAELTNIFQTRSMVSLSQRVPKLDVRRASELYFEEEEEEDKIDLSNHEDDRNSYDSLDLMLGYDGVEENPTVRPIRQLIKETVVMNRDAVKQLRTKSAASFSFDGRKGRRRGKSIRSNANVLKARVMTEETDETASDIFDAAEEFRQEHYMTSLLFPSIPQKKHHVNLREYSIIGGTYLLDIIVHELQPNVLHNGNTVQIFNGEMNIKRDGYVYNYKPPVRKPHDNPDEPVTDPGLQHLLHVKLLLPQDIVILEPPIVALWDRESKFWTKEHVHNVDINLESYSTSFSIERALPFAFFMRKYHLFPLDDWSMKPNLDAGGVMLTLQGTKVILEFHVEGFQVCLSKAETVGEGCILQISSIIGVFMHLHKLIALMKSKGLDVFPDEDGFLYTHSSCKDVVLEDHTYLSMAMFADSLEFSACDMNTGFKRQKVIFRARECLAYQLELRYRTVVATSLSAQIYSLGMEETSLDETKFETAYGFCPDVYSLLDKAFAHVASSSPVNPLQILAVYSLLSRTKVLSYSGGLLSDKSSLSTASSKREKRKRIKKIAKMKMTKSTKSRSSNTPSVISQSL